MAWGKIRKCMGTRAKCPGCTNLFAVHSLLVYKFSSWQTYAVMTPKRSAKSVRSIQPVDSHSRAYIFTPTCRRLHGGDEGIALQQHRTQQNIFCRPPGPCPPCPQTVRVTCHCGSQPPQTRRCGNKEWTCGQPCGRSLSCNQHYCPSPCHPGKQIMVLFEKKISSRVEKCSDNRIVAKIRTVFSAFASNVAYLR